MNYNRLAAWACGIISLLLVIMAGKSCTDTMYATKKTNPTAQQNEDEGFEIITPDIPMETKSEYVLDEFGRPVKAPESTEAAAEPETDEDGNIIEKETSEPATDENGEIIVQETAEAETDISEEAAETETAGDEDVFFEAPVQHHTDVFGRVIEKQNNEDSEKNDDSSQESTAPELPPNFGGFDHAHYDEEGNVIPTIPPDFVIKIN